MKIYKKDTVYEASIKRIDWLFDEFENVIVGFSGGKDSVVTLELALEVARKKDRLPLKVLFIDQEAEWQGTIDLVEEVMSRPEVEPLWFQMPMVITNNASSYERYSYCWEEGKEDKWIHPKHPLSIKENVYGTDRFHELFTAILKKDYADQRTCYLAGVRTEEAPKRFVALTQSVTYKGYTWGKILNKKLDHYTLYPIYDWSYTDVWKAIQEKDWNYNVIYNEMYRHGVNVRDMRISNVHHETAIQNLLLIQEIEPKTWVKLTDRIDGVNTVKHLKEESFKCPKDLPPMFEDWEEYALHLIENLVTDQKNKDAIMKKLEHDKALYNTPAIIPVFYRTVINTILSADWDFTKWTNWTMQMDVMVLRKIRQKKAVKRGMMTATKFLSPEDVQYLIDNINKKVV